MINQAKLEADMLLAAGADILRDAMRNVNEREQAVQDQSSPGPAAEAAPVEDAVAVGNNRRQEKLHRDCLMELNNEFMEMKNRLMIRKKEIEMRRHKLQRVYEELNSEADRDLLLCDQTLASEVARLNKAADAHRAAIHVLTH